jgi:heme-degrading monooxygenase HmoA
MIVRAWRGRAAPENPRAYIEHFQRNVVPQLQSLKGFLGATLLQERRSDEIEFLVLTRWESMAAIRAFAGDDCTRAVVEPQAVAALIGFDQTAQHFEVVQEIPVS